MAKTFIKKRFIKTTKKMREMYIKHLNKLDDYAKGIFNDKTCYLCEAANLHPKYKRSEKKDVYIGDCTYCPLPGTGADCNSSMRSLNLEKKVWNKTTPTSDYYEATPESIIKHRDWIQKQIEEVTDCEFYFG